MNHNNPLISIIVPIYGVAEYLDKCVASLVGQTYEHIEIILVDDGSPDACPAMCDAWAKKDARIKVVHTENSGQSSARNHGLDIAQGEYIAFVDSDDWLSLHCIETQLETATRFDADIAVIYPQNHQNNKIVPKPFYRGEPNDAYCLTAKESVKFFLEQNVAVMAKLYKKGLFDTIRFPKGRKAEEYMLQLQVLDRTERVAFCNQHLYQYLVRATSDSHQIKPKYRVDNIQAISETLDKCKVDYPEQAAWAYTWLAALLHEFYAVGAFGKEEKELYAPILQYALEQVGGLQDIILKVENPLDRILYIAQYYRKYITADERKQLQKEYRQVYRTAKRTVRGLRAAKYILGYVDIRLV